MQEDELLSSYISRLIHLLGCPVNTFCRQILNDPNALKRDIDLYQNQVFEEKLRPYGFSQHKPLSERLKWARVNSEFVPQCPDVLNVNFLGIKRLKFGQQFCPECLKQDRYFKWIWRLAIIPICTIHGVMLRDRCPHCQQPIISAKVSSFVPDLSYCSYCWESLLVKTRSVDEEDLLFIRSIEDGIKSGWYEYDGFSMYTPLFMQGVWRIVYAFYGTNGRSKGVWEKLCAHFNRPCFELSSLRIYNALKDEIPDKRLMVISLIRLMLINWPDEMIAACESSGITKTVLDLPNSGLPFWMQKIAETNLNKNWYKISLEEFDSALNYLYCSDSYVTKANVVNVLGLDNSKKLNKQEKRILKIYIRLNVNRV